MSRISRRAARRYAFILVPLFFIAMLLLAPLYEITGTYLQGVRNRSVELTVMPLRRLGDMYLIALAKLRLSLLSNRKAGISAVHLYVSEQAQQALLANPPDSLGRWRKGYLLYPDGNIRKIKIRHRGDRNPINYSLTKKSWRIKTSREALFMGRRVVNYVVPHGEEMIGEVVAAQMAHEMGVLVASARLVELFLNDTSQGIYHEIEHLDEVFLRSNGLMPVNIYKGDHDRDNVKGLHLGLFESPGVWSKTAINNQYSKDDRSDLEQFLNLVRDAESSDADLVRLRRQADFDTWARFAAMQVLVQSWHNDWNHNMRLVIDDQSGTVQPIPWDISPGWLATEFIRNVGSHPLMSLYLRQSEFVLTTLRYIYEFGIERSLPSRSAALIDQVRPALAHSIIRDIGRLQIVPFARAYHLFLYPLDTLKVHDEIKDNLYMLESWLRDWLNGRPDVTWESPSGQLRFVLAGDRPVDELAMTLNSTAPLPTRLALDIDSDGQIGVADFPLIFETNGRTVKVVGTWLANREIKAVADIRSTRYYFDTTQIVSIATRFEIVADIPLEIAEVSARNALSGEAFTLRYARRRGVLPQRRNRPVNDYQRPTTAVWSGTHHFSQTSVITNPVLVEAGTRIVLNPGVSIVFRGKLTVDGTSERPVVVRPSGEGPWGTVAIHGANTEGSVIQNFDLEGGSGGIVEGTAYIGMFSINATRDVLVNGLTMRRNHHYDDMLHVVYSSNIRLHNLDISDAWGDAVDIDLSQVEIADARISGSGNDCIDLMTSEVVVVRSVVSECGDKGLSIGEKTSADIVESVIRSSNIGLEVKDSSQVRALHVDFVANRSQINAYKKNWRYGGGGQLSVAKSFFDAGQESNVISADSTSSITVTDSGFSGPIRLTGNVTVSQNIQPNSRIAHSTRYSAEFRELAHEIGLTIAHARRRGSALQ